MSIEFQEFPQSWRSSIVAIELRGVKKSVLGTGIPQIGLIPGQYDQAKAASITDYVPVQVFSADEMADKAGFGSESHRQALWVFSALGGFSSNVWWSPVPEPGSAVKASGDVVFATNSSSSGTYFFSIGGVVVSFSVPSGSTPTEIGDLFVAAITASQNIAVTASNSSGTVTITAKTAGVNGNEISIVQNPGGETQAALAPSGTTVAVPGSGGYLTSGSGVTDVHDVFFQSDESDNLGDRWYTQISGPYTDSTNIGYYNDSWALRKAPDIRRRFDSTFGFVKETYSQAFAKPATINSEGISPVWEPRSYAPHWELQAAVMGLKMASAEIDPGRPFKTLTVGIPVNSATGDLTEKEYNALFKAGMGFCRIISGSLKAGDMAISYRTNAVGAATEEWFDSVSQTRRQQLVYDVEQLFKNEPYIRGIVADDTSITTKSYVIKPKKVISDLSALVDAWSLNGWVKNAASIKESIAAEINAGNNSRIDAEMTIDEALALRIVGIVEKFLF
jgi:phage tail sheath gpL-like